MNYLGIDYGSAHIGLAIGDGEMRMAFPYKSLENSGEGSIDELTRIILSEGIDEIVVGMPNNPGYSDTQREDTQNFIHILAGVVRCPIHEWDERFTSKEAQTRLRESGGDEHAIAAMLILQSYLDSHDV